MIERGHYKFAVVSFKYFFKLKNDGAEGNILQFSTGAKIVLGQ